MNPNTSVLLYTGIIKKLKDLAIGDYIMGINSRAIRVDDVLVTNSVASLIQYKVSQKIGDDYTVNPDQTLLFKLKNNKVSVKTDNGWEVGWYSRTDSAWITKTFRDLEQADDFANDLQSNSTLKIIANELAHNPSLVKHCLGSKESVTFMDSGAVLPITPYLLGVWVGKRDSYNSQINEYIHKLKPPCLPDDYKCNSVEVRQQLLAGILDSKGRYLTKHNCFEVYLGSYKQLQSDILYLARSLGYLANAESESSKVYITGNFSVLPMQLKRNYPQGEIELVSGVSLDREESGGKSIKLKLNPSIPFLLGDFSVVVME